MAKPDYHEGDWFAVPLDQGGYALGIIARTNPLGVLLGYFFGPRRAQLPTLDDVAALRADDAVWITRFADRGLRGRSRSGRLWPVLGRSADWDRSAWPMPVFGRLDAQTGFAYRIFYLDNDPGSRPTRRRAPSYHISLVEGLPRDGMASPDQVEQWLDDLLGKS
jgi:hypothetical protein